MQQPANRGNVRIQSIQTEADHDAAVARIAELISAKHGTEEWEELDILATLVDAYEAKHHSVGIQTADG
jgi:HTH-type transcriptional regulator/antitoxin HigA